MKLSRKARLIAGAALICLSLAVLIAALLLTRSPVRVESFAATGRTGEPATPTQLTGSICINTATAEELEALPGISARIAAAIVAEREAHGPFRLPEDIMAVSGIGEKKLEAILPFIRLD